MWRICLAVLATTAMIVAGGTAYAMDSIANSTLGAGGGVGVHEFRAGDGFDIVGDCLVLARSSRDVRVVLQLNDKPASSVGYSSVLVTEQKLDENALHVRVPEMPEMSHHTYKVRVFAVDSESPSTCEAGQIRIG